MGRGLTLEREIVPLYYDRGLDDVPHNWVAVMKAAIRTCAPRFSMRRMVKDYVNLLYVPALLHGARMDADTYALARELAKWKRDVRDAWGQVVLRVEGPREGALAVGQPITVTALVALGVLTPDDVRVELVAARDEDGAPKDARIVRMELLERAGKGERGEGTILRYQAQLAPDVSGSLVYGVRVVPYHSGLAHAYDLGLARWA